MQETSTFPVRNTVKVISGYSSRLYMSGNRMRCYRLIFLESPTSLALEEVPSEGDVFKALGFVHAHVRDHVSEGLIQPQVIPPFHSN